MPGLVRMSENPNPVPDPRVIGRPRRRDLLYFEYFMRFDLGGLGIVGNTVWQYDGLRDMEKLRATINEAAAKYPKPEGKKFEYGTAGFRMNNQLLDSVVFRMGLLAELRSRRFHGKTIGVMITASHNPAEDNGVKLVEPMGEMLEESWEAHATELANANDEDVANVYFDIDKKLDIQTAKGGVVVFARDTRASGARLVAALRAGLECVNTEYQDYKFLTTPQLHYMVRCYNTKGTPYDFGEPTEQGYYKKLAAAYSVVMKGRKTQGRVIVDCANGVGGPKLHELIKYLPDAQHGGVEIKVVNDDVLKPESLNHQCGADFVKTNQRAPPSSKADKLERCASFDGDADRIVYYYTDENGTFQLLDGDRIATLAALFIAQLVETAKIGSSLRIGIIQTAYANGASTEYIEKILKLMVQCTATGVKHLHHAATRFDIGIYFEANGHGTVVIGDNARRRLADTEPKSPAQQAALETLKALIDLINQAVGDALSDLLLVECILAHKSWGPAEWITTYTDLPSRLVKVVVPDRSRFKTYDEERKLRSPGGIQDGIDQLQSQIQKGRSFVRASGTEDAVRVYAEAAVKSEADSLAHKVAALVVDAVRVRTSYG